jgi:hypothetical protein
MSLKTRIEKLEKPYEQLDTPKVILLVGVSPNDEQEREIIGWGINSVEYFKRSGESYDSFSERVQSELVRKPVIAIAIYDDE